MLKKIQNKKKVFVGMSGGVDSSVSAALLKKQGFDVVGVFIKTWHPEFLSCNEEEERRDAMRVCAYLDIPFLTFDFEDVYKKEVADYMIKEYKRGFTPNPDVMCNKEVKFGAFFKKAISMGADYVATGHYARIAHSLWLTADRENQKLKAKSYNLKVGLDPTKDQSYFLWTLKQEQLNKVLFPIGNIKKTEVRKLAKKFKLPVAEKKDSQGICFLGAVDLKDFLKHYIKEKKGKVLLAPSKAGNEKEEEIGYHNGVFFYTLGERHGFVITKKNSNNKPFYIIKKDIKKNILIVSNEAHIEESFKKSQFLLLEDVNWILNIPKVGKKYKAQIRYHGEFLDCSIKKIKKDKIEIMFKESILVDKGQSCVLYDKDTILGGGIII